MKKIQVWIPLLFSIIMIFGMLIGYRLHGNISPKGFLKTRRQAPVQEVIDLVNQKYVDSVSIDTLGTNAIQGMLAHLDPHSVYIPASDLGEVNEDLQGNFEGIGVEFQIFDDTVNVVSVMANGPSEKAGLQVGDKFLKVNDSLVAGNGIDADRIKKLLRGPGSSEVVITLLRANQQENIKIMRGTIPSPSVDVAYMITQETGFLHLNRFSATTHGEFAQAVMKLQQEGMKKMILDIRGNGGGVLQEAVAIADDFLDQDKLIVYTQGINSPKVEYRCRVDGLFEKGQLILLVDEGTASASEILAGALQDWDRATIIGRRTFGKGLVQEQYQLSDGSALRLTVARYYTPLGRSIQKPYNKDDHDAYNEEVMTRFHDGEMLHGDTTSKHPGTAYKTKEGHIVYGGGGITPDIFIAFDTSRLNRNVTALYLSNTLTRFLYTYYMQNIAYFNKFKTVTEFVSGFHDEEKVWRELVDYASKDTIDIKSIPARDKQLLMQRIKSLLARQIWHLEGFFEISNIDDIVVKKAVDLTK
jgi:carboxyl-terminal processing protease